MKRFVSGIMILAFTAALFSCSGATHQEGKTKTGVLAGAGIGAIAGQAIGRNTKGTLIGAAVGAAVGGIAGNRIGAYMDQQEQALRNAVAASEAANIQRTQDVLTATFKGDFMFDTNSAALKPGGGLLRDRQSGQCACSVSPNPDYHRRPYRYDRR